jgi:hypothetical protein
MHSYCSLRVNVSQLESLFKCIFKRFAENWCLWKYRIRIRTACVLTEIKNFTANFFIRRDDAVRGIQGIKANNSFKTILESKSFKHSTRMSRVCIGKKLQKGNNKYISHIHNMIKKTASQSSITFNVIKELTKKTYHFSKRQALQNALENRVWFK